MSHKVKILACSASEPLAKQIGLESGLMTTVHAYTNDQNLVDNMHKKEDVK